MNLCLPLEGKVVYNKLVKSKYSKDSHECSGCNCSTDNSGNVGSHCVHQKEVRRICLCADFLRNSGSHGNGGNSGRTDKRINLAFCKYTHNLTEYNSGCCTERECYKSENNDCDSLEIKECFCTCYIITVDDDVLYPENLVELLMETSKEYPDTVVCTWAHRITLDGDGEISRPGEWKHETSGIEPSYSVIPTGIGGVLYPPGILDIEVFNQTSIRKLCLNADDLWLKAMAVRNHRKAVRINRPAKIYFSILKTQKTGLYYDNALKNKNDVAWDNIMQAYHECEEFLKESLLAER